LVKVSVVRVKPKLSCAHEMQRVASDSLRKGRELKPKRSDGDRGKFGGERVTILDALEVLNVWWDVRMR
jgi:hypothetical protein